MMDNVAVLPREVFEQLERGVMPVGSIVRWPGDVTKPPPGWLFCDGRMVSRAELPHLWEACGRHLHKIDQDAKEFPLPDPHEGPYRVPCIIKAVPDSNPEHRQQDRGKHLGSCWDCVNDMRLDCLELLARVVACDMEKLGAGTEREMRLLSLRVDAATAYLAHTSFTDEDTGMATGFVDRLRQDVTGQEPPVVAKDGPPLAPDKVSMPGEFEDIHEWLTSRFPHVADAVHNDIYTKWDIVVMFRNAAGDAPLARLNESMKDVWKPGLPGDKG